MTLPANAPSSILCVCLGNICRSPTAEEVFRQNLAIAGLNIKVDSAGTSATHSGEAPDTRSQAHAKARGYKLKNIRSRQVTDQDFHEFDLIIAMDNANLGHLQAMRANLASEQHHKGIDTPLAEVYLLSEHDPVYAAEPLPDPYYGGEQGFEDVLDRCESSIQAWIKHWQDA